MPLVTREVNIKKDLEYSVEFFHIYTDEIINGRHTMGLEYLKAIEATWSLNYKRIILVDNYNPDYHTLSAEDVLKYLEKQKMLPDYWAYEKDLVNNAQLFLESVSNRKLRNSYLRYVEKTNKYPCSLLTAAWYLTRLGYLEAGDIIKSTNSVNPDYKVVDRLFNLLPQDYKNIEERAKELILKSEYSEAADKIQDLFYPADSGRASDLF